MNKERKLNKGKIISCIIIIVMIVASIYLLAINYKINKYKNLTIIYNGEKIDFVNEPVVEFNEDKALSDVFLSTNDVTNLFDKNLFASDIEIITTYGDDIAYIDIGDNQMQINDSDESIEGVVLNQSGNADESIYVSLSKMKDFYGISMDYEDKINTVRIDAGVGNDAQRNDAQGNGTPGNNDGLSSDQERKEIKLYNQYNNISGIYEGISVDESKLNIVSPKLFFIGNKGNVKDETNHNSAAYTIYDRWAGTNKLTIVPRTVAEIDGDAFETYDQRKGIATSLIEYLKRYKYDYVSIDIKDIKNVDTFKRFIIELSPRAKKAVKKVIWIYNKAIDKNEIAEFVNYIIEE